jgi:hypothetical protein
MGGGMGGGGGWGGGHRHGGGGGGGEGSASAGDQGDHDRGSGNRPARLPNFIHITETASEVSFEDSSGAVLQEIATVPAEADTFARAPGAQHVTGQWSGDKLVVERPGPRDAKITETITLKDKGKSLQIETKIEGSGDMPSREFKRVYDRVVQS